MLHGNLSSASSSKIASADGVVSVTDPTCIEIVSITSPMEGTSTNRFTNMDMSGNGITTGGTIKIKGLKACTDFECIIVEIIVATRNIVQNIVIIIPPALSFVIFDNNFFNILNSFL